MDYIKNKAYDRSVQTHNVVSAPISGSAESAYISCDGFDKVALTYSVPTDTAGDVTFSITWSHDGATDANTETTNSELGIKAPFLKVVAENASTTAAHDVTAWAYLKG